MFSIPVNAAVISSIGTIQTITLPWSVSPNHADDGDGHHRAEHEDVAVREVDQLEDAVDERVAERDQRVDHPERQADDEQVEQVRRRLGQVDEQPDGDERDEHEREDLNRRRAKLAAALGRRSSAVWVATGSG